MRCAIGQHRDVQPGTTSVTLARSDTTIVFRDVPAEVCETCGEAFIAAKVTARLHQQAEEALASGAKIEVRSYAA